MSFYPQISNVSRSTKQLKAFSNTNVEVKYRDSSTVNSGVKQVTADSIKLDLTNGFNEQILTGSVRFKLGSDTYIDRTSTLYRNIDPANGSGTASGSIQYGTGIVELSSWTPNVDNQITLQSLTTTTDLQPVNHISFRTPVIPLRPGSLTVVASLLNGGQLTLTANEQGLIETTQAHGKVNYDTGFVDVYFYTKTEITTANRAEIEADPGYLSELEYTESSLVYIDAPNWIAADSIRYNAVAYTYIPLDKDILGLSATRLPIDGRVPIFRVGDIGVVAASKSQVLPSHVAGQTYDLNDQRISWCELEDSEGTKVPLDMYVVDYDYGKVTLSGDFALNTLVAPLTAAYRYQDLGLINDVQINGQITFTKALTHNYEAANTIVGSALVIGDMFSRYTSKFVQGTWNVWADTASGGSISANYNDALYPIEVTNKGAIQERWALVFTDNTNFRIIGEVSGQIGNGNINDDCMPINPITNAPYFKVKALGWGAGWASGNVLRFNTIASMYPIWCIRTVKQSEPTVLSDNFQIMYRGDIDRDI
jgi:hypothetical protein